MAKKRVGVITMHRVNNFGSVLQAYALQYVIQRMGFEVELIDYEYPNKFQYERGIVRPQLNWKTVIIRMMSWLHPYNRYNYRFSKFRKSYFRLSSYFKDFDAIHQDKPNYDIYVTGSDQVWNPFFTKGDSTFLLDFANETIHKVAYSPSFSGAFLDAKIKELYARLLGQYNYISVREAKDTGIIKELLGKESAVCLDPTLLLSANEWMKATSISDGKISDDGYILLYILAYSFNPKPYICDLATFLSKKLNLPIVVIGAKEPSLQGGEIKYVNDGGPLQFIKLFSRATCVVTSSFHGTAFAVNFGKPVYSVVNTAISDNRISSFLNDLKLSESIVPLGMPFDKITLKQDMELSQSELSRKRELSLAYLTNALNVK